MNNDPTKRLELLLAKQKQMKEQQSKLANTTKIEEAKEITTSHLIPTVEVTDPEVSTLAPILPTTGLFLDRNEMISKDSILKSLAPDTKKYERLELTAEETKRIQRSLGRMTTGASAVIPMLCRGSECSYHPKCVDGETLVLLADGNSKQIKDLVRGETIYSVNSENHLEKDTVIAHVFNGIKSCLTVKTEIGNSITLTSDHKVKVFHYPSDRFLWLPISDVALSIESYLLLSIEPSDSLEVQSFGDFYGDSIISIEDAGKREVYDIQVLNNSNFIAEGLVVHNCDFYLMDKVTIGESCLLEENLIEYWTSKYIDEFEIDLNSITELHTISRLVEITVKEMRMNMYMSIHDQDLMQDFITSVDEAGNEIINKGVSTAHTIREQLDQRKLKLLESLNATRERKAKLQLGAMQTIQEGTSLANLKTLVEKMNRRLALSDEDKVVNK